MNTEVELKLRLPPSQARRLQDHPLLSETTPQRYRLLNTYYDTPEQDLRRRGIALRIRRKDRTVWLMTVKGGDPGAGGLAQRSEWEAPTQPGVFDFTIVTDQDLREFLELHHGRLQAVFSTDFTRTAWTLNRAGERIELALDRGKINAPAAGDRSEPISEPLCEVELELIKGESPAVLFDLAIELSDNLHLHPESYVSLPEIFTGVKQPAFS
ncbi:inorganic triphosphatase, partial [Propionivibrio sp.]|uniref:CYTH domain-containing protein n=1 Tax=Propionivibrio sp. TaxID=2212460 RepID=UPI003BF1F1BB